MYGLQGCAVCILLLLLPLVPRQEGGGTDPMAQVLQIMCLLAGQVACKNLCSDTMQASELPKRGK